jgi:hypothetical protein
MREEAGAGILARIFHRERIAPAWNPYKIRLRFPRGGACQKFRAQDSAKPSAVSRKSPRSFYPRLPVKRSAWSIANGFIASSSFQPGPGRFQSTVMLRRASQISLLAASSFGKCPRVLMILRGRGASPLLAFVGVGFETPPRGGLFPASGGGARCAAPLRGTAFSRGRGWGGGAFRTSVLLVRASGARSPKGEKGIGGLPQPWKSGNRTGSGKARYLV